MANNYIIQMAKNIIQWCADLEWKEKDWRYKLDYVNNQKTRFYSLAEEWWKEIKKLINDLKLLKEML